MLPGWAACLGMPGMPERTRHGRRRAWVVHPAGRRSTANSDGSALGTAGRGYLMTIHCTTPYNPADQGSQGTFTFVQSGFVSNLLKLKFAADPNRRYEVVRAQIVGRLKVDDDAARLTQIQAAWTAVKSGQATRLAAAWSPGGMPGGMPRLPGRDAAVSRWDTPASRWDAWLSRRHPGGYPGGMPGMGWQRRRRRATQRKKTRLPIC